MTDLKRIYQAMNNLLSVMEAESPKCPYCSGETELSTDDYLTESILELSVDADDCDCYIFEFQYECLKCGALLKQKMDIDN